MARHKIFQVISGVFVVCAIGVRVARSVFDSPGLLTWDALLSVLSVVGMVIVVLWQVYRDGPVTGHRVRGAIAAYLLIAVLFTFSYTLVSHMVPGAFQLPAWVSETGPERSEAFLYFSMVALTTVGFGDITAIHPVARSLVIMEALIGQLYPAILLAAEQAREIVETHAEEFMGWLRSLDALSVIQDFRTRAEAIRDEVLDKALCQVGAGKSPEEALQFLANTLTNKLLHAPSAQLRAAGSSGQTQLLEAASTLFQLNADRPPR